VARSFLARIRDALTRCLSEQPQFIPFSTSKTQLRRRARMHPQQVKLQYSLSTGFAECGV